MFKFIPKVKASFQDWVNTSVTDNDINASQRDGLPPEFDAQAGVDSFFSWTYAAASMNAKGVAETPIRLYVRKRDGNLLWNTRKISQAKKRSLENGFQGSSTAHKLIGMGEVEEVTDAHPVIDLLCKPNPYQDGFSQMYLLTLFLELTGDAYLLSANNGLDVPEQLFTMMSQWTKAKVTEEEFIEGYFYGASNDDTQFFDASEVLHFKYPNPNSLVYGMGKVQAAWHSVTANQAVHEMDTAFFRNAGRPDYAVIVKNATVNDSILKRAEMKMKGLFKGVANTGRPIFMTGDTDIKPLQFPPKDLTGREEIVSEIAAVFGIPEPLLKMKDSILANSDTAVKFWKSATIRPTTKLIQDVLNTQLLPMFEGGDDLVIVFDDPSPEDQAAINLEVRSNYQAGLITRDEARIEIDMPELKGEEGESFATDVPEQAAPAFPAFNLSAPQPDIKVNNYIEQPALPEPVVEEKCEDDNACTHNHKHKAISFDYRAQFDDDTENTRVIDEQEKIAVGEGTVEDGDEREGEPVTPQNKMATNIARILRDQQAALLSANGTKAFGYKILDTNSAKIADILEGFNQELFDAIREPLEDIARVGGETGFDRIGLSADIFDLEAPGIQDFIDSTTVRLVREVQGVTLQRAGNVVSGAISEGASQGLTNDEIARNIQSGLTSDGNPFSSSRAVTIARTESARAYVGATEKSWEVSDIVSGKKWNLAAGACEFCQATAKAFNKNGGLPINGKLSPSGGVITAASGRTLSLDYMGGSISGAPLHPNCRCGITPIME